PVAPELALLDDQLVVARFPRRVADLLAHRGDRTDRFVMVAAVTLIDHRDDLIDEAVEPDNGPAGRQVLDRVVEPLRGREADLLTRGVHALSFLSIPAGRAP